MGARPTVRARGAQDTFAHLDRVEPEVAARIREYLHPQTLVQIEEAPRTAWVPLELDSQMAAAWTDLFDREESIRIMQGITLSVLDTPILRPLLTSAVRLLGTSPAAILKIFPRGWTQMYRDCCTLRVETLGPERARLHVENMHPAFREVFPSYEIILEATIRAAYKLTDCSGSVEFHRAPGGIAYADLRWAPHARWTGQSPSDTVFSDAVEPAPGDPGGPGRV